MNASSQASVAPQLRLRSAIGAVIRKSAGGHPEFVRAALESLHKEIKIAAISKRAGREFQRLKDCRDLKAHLGCGPDIREGWINIDLAITGTHAVSGGAFINYDLRRGLPLAEESCALIYSSHFFEHLEYPVGLRLMRDCHRALQPGGAFRVALPNFKGVFAAYVAGDRSYFEFVEPVPLSPGVARGSETLADYVNYAAYQFGEHKCIYDEKKAIAALVDAGFRSARAVAFCPEIDVDTAERTHYSFYIEAAK